MKIPRLPEKEEDKRKKLSIREAMAAGWQLFRTKFWTSFWMLVLASFIVSVPSFLTWFSCIYFRQGAMLNLILYVIAPVAIVTVVSIVSLGTLNVLLRILDDQDVTALHIFSRSGRLITFLIAAILYGLASSLGLMLFFIPGVMIMIAFQFYPYFIVDHDTGPIQALKASRAITAGARWKLFFLAVILGLIQGISVFFLWWTVFVPFLVMIYVFLTYTCAYRLMLLNTPAQKLPFEFAYTPPVEVTAGANNSTADDERAERQSATDAQNLPSKEPGKETPGELSIADRAERMDLEIANMIASQGQGEKLDITRKEVIAPQEVVAPQSIEPGSPDFQTAKPESTIQAETAPPAEQKDPINNQSQEASDELR